MERLNGWPLEQEGEAMDKFLISLGLFLMGVGIGIIFVGAR